MAFGHKYVSATPRALQRGNWANPRRFASVWAMVFHKTTVIFQDDPTIQEAQSWLISADPSRVKAEAVVTVYSWCPSLSLGSSVTSLSKARSAHPQKTAPARLNRNNWRISETNITHDFLPQKGGRKFVAALFVRALTFACQCCTARRVYTHHIPFSKAVSC